MADSLPLTDWLRRGWPSEKSQIEKLPFVAGPCEIVRLEKGYGALVAGLFVPLRVDLPSGGPVCDVRQVEHMLIGFRLDFPRSRPHVLLRHDFPAVAHLTSRYDNWRIACLTRRDHDDWWCGRTSVQVVKDVYDWLCDAAAGRLVKPEDPFEPLIVSSTNPPVELDTAAVKAECDKHRGPWMTEVTELTVGGRDVRRFTLPGKGVPACVWFQPTTCDAAWIDPPRSLDDIIHMAVSVGVNKERLLYWVNKGSHPRLLLVLGVKRSRVVLGRPDVEEWVAFDLERPSKRSGDWQVESHPVLDNFSTRLARLSSGFPENRAPVWCLLIGAGALGSAAAESLVRSGVVYLRVVDEDVLRPHNLARHALDACHIGQFKASALAAELNGLYEGRESVSEGVDDNFLNLSPERTASLVQDIDFVLDCSASLAVQLRLTVLDLPVPIICAYQIAAGQGTIILFQPTGRAAPLDMLEAFVMTAYRDDQVVASWLREAGDPIMIGGGCRSLSSRIADSTVKMGASWVADLALRWCGRTNAWPTESRVGLMRYRMDGSGEISTVWTAVTCREIKTSNGWAIRVADSVGDQVNHCAQEALPRETGGIMIGRVDRQRRVINITEAWSAPKGSAATESGFTRGLGGLKAAIARLESHTGDQLSYVGEWHSHPPGCGRGLSATDSATAKRMAEELDEDKMPAVCLVANDTGFDAHVVENRT